MIEYFPDAKPIRTPKNKGTMVATYPVCIGPHKHRAKRDWRWLWVCSECGYEQVTVAAGCYVHICPCQGGKGKRDWKREDVGTKEWQKLGNRERTENLEKIKTAKYEDSMFPCPPAGKGSAQDYMGVNV